jgi:hypothetical protein
MLGMMRELGVTKELLRSADRLQISPCGHGEATSSPSNRVTTTNQPCFSDPQPTS